MEHISEKIDRILVSDVAVEFGIDWLSEDKGNSLESGDLSNLLRYLLREVNQLKSDKQKFEIETVDRYFYFDGRNSKRYVETTFWINPFTLKEKKHSEMNLLVPDRNTNYLNGQDQLLKEERL